MVLHFYHNMRGSGRAGNGGAQTLLPVFSTGTASSAIFPELHIRPERAILNRYGLCPL